MQSTTVGIDLAKTVFSVCIMDGNGRVGLRKVIRREGLDEWLIQLPEGTVVAMEACSSAHYWGRNCEAHRLTPKLMAAQFVAPFRKSAVIKNDRNDAEAIATAARQGNMRFVRIKTEEQQERLCWHRVREGYKHDMVATSNRIRGLLMEFGVAIPRSFVALRRKLAELNSLPLPTGMKELVSQEQLRLTALEEGLAACTQRILERAHQDERCLRLCQLVGVGLITADAVVGTLGNASDFKNGRQFAAWIGLTPMQYGTGGKVQLGKISCRGDGYLRMLLIQGARSSVKVARNTPADKATPEQQWIMQLAVRMSFGKLIVAIANKHARQMWAMLAREEDYDPDAWLKHPMVQRA